MKNAHFDPDLGYIHTHLDDNGDIEIHRDSGVNGHSMMPLGITSRGIAIDILRLTGQADAAAVQSIANTIEARADAGDVLSASEMRGIVAALRFGVGAPIVPVLATRPDAVVVQFRPRVVAVRVEGMVG